MITIAISLHITVILIITTHLSHLQPSTIGTTLNFKDNEITGTNFDIKIFHKKCEEETLRVIVMATIRIQCLWRRWRAIHHFQAAVYRRTRVQLGLEVANVRTAVRNIVTAKQALEDGTAVRIQTNLRGAFISPTKTVLTINPRHATDAYVEEVGSKIAALHHGHNIPPDSLFGGHSSLLEDAFSQSSVAANLDNLVMPYQGYEQTDQHQLTTLLASQNSHNPSIFNSTATYTGTGADIRVRMDSSNHSHGMSPVLNPSGQPGQSGQLLSPSPNTNTNTPGIMSGMMQGISQYNKPSEKYVNNSHISKKRRETDSGHGNRQRYLQGLLEEQEMDQSNQNLNNKSCANGNDIKSKRQQGRTAPPVVSNQTLPISILQRAKFFGDNSNSSSATSSPTVR